MWLTNGGAKVQTLVLRKHFSEKTKTMFSKNTRQEYWSGLLFPPPGDLPDPGIQPVSPELWADSLPTEPPGKPG